MIDCPSLGLVPYSPPKVPWAFVSTTSQGERSEEADRRCALRRRHHCMSSATPRPPSRLVDTHLGQAVRGLSSRSTGSGPSMSRARPPTPSWATRRPARSPSPGTPSSCPAHSWRVPRAAHLRRQRGSVALPLGAQRHLHRLRVRRSRDQDLQSDAGAGATASDATASVTVDGHTFNATKSYTKTRNLRLPRGRRRPTRGNARGREPPTVQSLLASTCCFPRCGAQAHHPLACREREVRHGHERRRRSGPEADQGSPSTSSPSGNSRQCASRSSMTSNHGVWFGAFLLLGC